MASDADDDDTPSQNSSDEDSSGTDDFDEDLAAISRACTLTGTDPDDIQPTAKSPPEAPSSPEDTDSDEDDDELLRGTYQRYAEVPLYLEPLKTLPPAASDEDENGFESDEDEDDLEILQGVEHRCDAYFTGFVESSEKYKLKTSKQTVDSSVALERETSFELLADRSYVSEGSPNSLDVHSHSQKPELLPDRMDSPSGSMESHHQDHHDVSISPPQNSSFPKSASLIVNSLNKNRACQQFLRDKIIQIQARIEENEKLKQRVKILKEFQVSCKRRTGRALSQKKDPRLQLILARTPNPNLKTKGKKNAALYNGPEENLHVANYKSVLTKFPISLSREKWTDKEKDNLARGIKRQIQELLVQKSVDLIRNMDGTSSQGLDSIYASIGDLDITPEHIRSFLPKVDWERLVSLYVPGRSGEECEARWLNFEDPLINHNSWTKMEEKKLLRIIQEKGIEDWIDIAISLGTNKTPSQCLAHYQRSLNPSILKSEWTEDEDAKLRAAVEECGESNWKVVASLLEGRTGTQCSNRWIKSLHPARKMLGKWTSDEDKRLRVAVMLFGPKSWREIAKFVPGRTHVQCRERWSNSLDPNINMGKWSEEEDARLIAEFKEHLRVFMDTGKDQISWAKVAASMSRRTDSQCRRRTLLLFPKLKSVLRDAKKLQAKVGLRNFVDRESERPALALNDFIPLTLINSVLEPENMRLSRKKKRSRSKRSAKEALKCPEDVLLLTNGDLRDEDAIPNKKKVMRPRQKKKEGSKPIADITKNHEEVKQCNVGLRKSSFGRLLRRTRKADASSSDDVSNRRVRNCQKKHKSTRHIDIQPSSSAGSELTGSLQGEAADLGDAEEGLSLQLTRVSKIYPEEVLRNHKEVQKFRGKLNSKRRIRKHSLGSKTFVYNVLSDSGTISDDDQPLAKIAHRNRRRTFKRKPLHPSFSETREADEEVKTPSLGSETYVNDALSDSATLSDDDEPLAKFVPRKRRRTFKACARKSQPLGPPCSETREANDEISILGGNNSLVGRKRMFDQVYTRRRKGSQSGEPQNSKFAWLDTAELPTKQSKSPKAVKSSNFGASLKRGRLKSSRDRDDSLSDREVEDGSEVTLANFIKGKQKKRIELSSNMKCCEIGTRNSPFFAEMTSSHKKLREGGFDNIESFCEADDDESDVDLHPPGFEYPIYRKEVADLPVT